MPPEGLPLTLLSLPFPAHFYSPLSVFLPQSLFSDDYPRVPSSPPPPPPMLHLCPALHRPLSSELTTPGPPPSPRPPGLLPFPACSLHALLPLFHPPS